MLVTQLVLGGRHVLFPEAKWDDGTRPDGEITSAKNG
jgi:hypothetical protein